MTPPHEPLHILVADDDPLCRRVVLAFVAGRGYTVTECENGETAWEALRRDEALSLAILDWQMPGLTGPEICRRVRQTMPTRPLHLIVVTATWVGIDALVEVFEAGADDYLCKPLDARELRARLRVGERMVQLQRQLAAQVSELEASLANVHRLEGLLPICAYCKRVRDDGNYWHEVEHYVAERSGASFSHSLCPDCAREHFPEFAGTVLGETAGGGSSSLPAGTLSGETQP